MTLKNTAITRLIISGGGYREAGTDEPPEPPVEAWAILTPRYVFIPHEGGDVDVDVRTELVWHIE